MFINWKAVSALAGREITSFDDLRKIEQDNKMSDEELEEAIDKIPGGSGWWKSGPKKDYIDLAKILIAKGVHPDDAVYILNDAYWAAVDCYGG